jgi:hypothetical protein
VTRDHERPARPHSRIGRPDDRAPLLASLDEVEHAESFSIEDATGQVLAYVYFEDAPGRRRRPCRHAGIVPDPEQRNITPARPRVPNANSRSAPAVLTRAPECGSDHRYTGANCRLARLKLAQGWGLAARRGAM